MRSKVLHVPRSGTVANRHSLGFISSVRTSRHVCQVVPFYRRIPRWRNRGPTQGRPKIQPEHRLGLVRSRTGSDGVRLLQYASLVLTAEA
jgi:hypothetical protein